MNLGQLIGYLLLRGDANTAELRGAQRPAASAPCPPLGLVVHRASDTGSDDQEDAGAPRSMSPAGGAPPLVYRVRGILAKAGKPLSPQEVHALLSGEALDRVRTVLHGLATAEEVFREGAYGAPLYTLTELGRSKARS